MIYFQLCFPLAYSSVVLTAPSVFSQIRGKIGDFIMGVFNVFQGTISADEAMAS